MLELEGVGVGNRSDCGQHEIVPLNGFPEHTNLRTGAVIDFSAKVDIVVNNAATHSTTVPLAGMDLAVEGRIIETNLEAGSSRRAGACTS